MESDFTPKNMTFTVKEREELGSFVELNYGYPQFVAVGKQFIKEMGKPQFVSPEVNLVQLESLIAGWIYAQPWFANMINQIPHDPQEVFEVVSDTVLQAATDASADVMGYPGLRPQAA